MDTLSIKNVSKSYGNYTAVDKISFNVREGIIFGVLGPNGAGKTSLIRIINSITAADEGEISFMGHELNREHQSEIGYLPEERGLYKKMNVQDQLEYLGQLKGLSLKEVRLRIQEWYDRFNMEGWEKKKIQDLSKGMQQKVQFVATILHQPKLLILDEPFSGLDPVNTNMMKQEILRLKEDGTTILFSTHRMEQVEEVCEEIVLMNQGRLVLTGGIEEIKQQHKDNIFQFTFSSNQLPVVSNDIEIMQNDNDSALVLQFEDLAAANIQMKKWLDEGYYLKEFHEILPSINDIFIKLVTAPSEVKPMVHNA
ncbi:ABC transporter ATP-binding protein [Membranihabitans marinus]|uniref:ABC transporter ATP-binding protein n=1 Tax=Membranihabitans marinus TaxID=1227546 RepID=UPI001F00CFDD|nr:ATP-binding cassette domain-containing protein [Membranihabitans marinus]